MTSYLEAVAQRCPIGEAATGLNIRYGRHVAAIGLVCGSFNGAAFITPGMCTEFTDQNGFTFAGCANRCRSAGTHMCSSGEMRAGSARSAS